MRDNKTKVPDMTSSSYYAPTGGLPPQTRLLTDRAVFTEAYAVIPKGTFSDIVTSLLPFWEKSRFWVIARPLSGFAETFSQYIAEVQPGGGSDRPETEPEAEAVLFVVEGRLSLTVEGEAHEVGEGGYAYIPPGAKWTLRNTGAGAVRFHWFRKRYQWVEGIDAPEPLVLNERDIAPTEMPDTGGVIPFAETHVMEHGLYVLEGKAVYRLNQDWVEVEAGDFMWLRAFCPQACYAGGPGPFRYLLYKDVNRHMPLTLGLG